jgi:hypothetical protein
VIPFCHRIRLSEDVHRIGSSANVHLNPSHLSFGVGVITPRWLFILAGATPISYGRLRITDETLELFDTHSVQPGDVIGIGIHTGNALRG